MTRDAHKPNYEPEVVRFVQPVLLKRNEALNSPPHSTKFFVLLLQNGWPPASPFTSLPGPAAAAFSTATALFRDSSLPPHPKEPGLVMHMPIGSWKGLWAAISENVDGSRGGGDGGGTGSGREVVGVVRKGRMGGRGDGVVGSSPSRH